MKLYLLVALSLAALPSCASNEITKESIVESSTETNSVVVQKARESGVIFISNSDQYQLISGGRAVQSGTSISGISASLSQGKFWEGENGPFDLTISSSSADQQNAQAFLSSSFNQIAFNSRTGGIAIITGQILVSYTADYDAHFIGTNFGIQLVDDFPHLKTAFYTVNPEQDIFIITNSLNQSGLVSSAEVEVIENFAMPN